MKVVLLAGGLGTRLSEETVVKPKPMVEIGGKPILWHIMKMYSHWGFHDFVICLGYKGYMIKEFFANYLIHQSDLTIDLRTNSSLVHSSNSEPWRITLVDTGDKTMTGGRICA
jgi:glucose-1-phosphate cytidylyltransferase